MLLACSTRTQWKAQNQLRSFTGSGMYLGIRCFCRTPVPFFHLQGSAIIFPKERGAVYGARSASSLPLFLHKAECILVLASALSGEKDDRLVSRLPRNGKSAGRTYYFFARARSFCQFGHAAPFCNRDAHYLRGIIYWGNITSAKLLRTDCREEIHVWWFFEFLSCRRHRFILNRCCNLRCT